MSKNEKKKLEENREIYRRFLYELYNETKLEVADEIMAKDYINHDPLFKEEIFHARGPAGIKQRIMSYKAGIPDLNFKDEILISEGEFVVCYWKGTGTHTGNFLGIEPSGKQINIKGIDILRIVDGKIVEGWDCPDLFTLFRQLGVINLPMDKT